MNIVWNNIFKIILDKHNDENLIKNIDMFLSYYSWTIEIVWHRKTQYPKLKVKWINKSEKYLKWFKLYSYKFILNKLIEYTKERNKILWELNKVDKLIKKLHVKNNSSELLKINNNILKLDKNINNADKNIEDKQNVLFDLKQEIEDVKKNNTNFWKRLVSKLSGKLTLLENNMQQTKNDIKSLKIERHSLLRELNSYKWEKRQIIYIITKIEKKKKDKLFLERELINLDTKLDLINKSFQEELKKRKIQII